MKQEEQLLAELRKTDYDALRALLVWQKGEMIFEYDAYGQGNTILHEVQSITKSIQTLLLGAIRAAGFLTDLDQPIVPFFEEYIDLDWSGGKKDITLRHLLTMTAGLDWNEAEVTYQNVLENHSNQMSDSPDWIRFALERKMRHASGTHFLYSSAAPVMLSHIIREATGKSNREWLEDIFFKPMTIQKYGVMTCPHNAEVLGDLDLTPHDLLKFGQLVLQKGTWEGAQLIDNEWIDFITTPVLQVDAQRSYGMMWWKAEPPLTFMPMTFAWGVGGQHLFIMPEYEAVMLTMGRFYETDFDATPFRLLNDWVRLLLEQNI